MLEFKINVKNIYAPGTLSPGTPDYDAPVLIKTVKAKDAKATALANSCSGYAAFLEDIKVDQFSNDKEYTILAYHTDGGFSPKVVTVMVVP